MIYAPTTPEGIDKVIYDIQTVLESKLSWTDKHIYGRIKRTTKNDSFVPTLNYSENKEYPEVFINDKKKNEVGFYVKDRDYSDWMHRSNVDIIFTVDLSSIGKYDEYVISNTEKILVKSGLIKEFGRIKEGIDNVFADFNTERIKYRDMYPFHVFSFETVIYYSTIHDCQ